jgi:cupin superfamily acireductone dioxygenase involved in methionine salvage
MSFDTMKVADLRGVAETFGVDLEDAKNKNEILAILAEEGVTYDMYSKFLNAEKEETEELEEEEVETPKPKAKKSDKNTVLIRMERKNPSYQTYGYVFSQEHPFVAVSENDAQEIFDNESGFRMATPREVQEFYS